MSWALRLGMLNLVWPGISHAIESIHAWGSIHFDKGLARAEKIYLEGLIATEDAREGIAAFLEKRLPKWTGR